MPIKNWFAAILILLSTSACKDEYLSSIPDAPVNLTCDLTNYFVQLTTPGQFSLVTKISGGYQISFPGKTPLAIRGEATNKEVYLGYGGLIIGNSSFSGYCAFDATCPVEASRKAILAIKNDGLGTAVCPKCGSEFDLNNGGIPVKGESKERLKQYKASLVSGATKLRVFN